VPFAAAFSKGAKPEDLPVQQAARVELTINLKGAFRFRCSAVPTR
jgi:hypothetical protein